MKHTERERKREIANSVSRPSERFGRKKIAQTLALGYERKSEVTFSKLRARCFSRDGTVFTYFYFRENA